MAQEIIKTSFAGGELTPALAGRVDLAKYQVGAAVMRNFFVDFRGGASTRAGTVHVGQCAILPDDPKPCLIPFVFNADQAYALELHDGTMRVIFRGAYVTEAAKTITGCLEGSDTVFLSTAHGFSTGDFVYIRDCVGLDRPNGISGVNGRLFRVGATLANQFTIEAPGPAGGPDYIDVPSNDWTVWASGGTAERVYEVTTPWAGANLFELRFAQSADVLTVVHPDFPAFDIRRLGQTNWQITQQTYGASVSAPSGLFVSAIEPDFSDPQYFMAYCVTTVDTAGRESAPSNVVYLSQRALDQNAQPNVANLLTWNPRAGAYKYRIYKATPVPYGQQGGGPYVFGLVGNSFETRFVDINYAPEFDQGPPQGRNPFLDKAIASATITNSGQGYVAPVLNITDASGSGASIALTSDLSNTASPYGEISATNVVAGGTNYTAPSGSVADVAPLGSGIVLAFSGAWVANPLGTGFVPAPGSITISNPGNNYHQASYSNFVRATAGNQVGTNVLPIDMTVEFGRVTAISWADADITPANTTGLSSTGAGDTLNFTVVGVDTPASGATVSLALGGTTNPSVVAYFEQRRVFAASRANPTTFWMSRPGQFTNFDVSDPTQDDDAITAALYAQEVNAITALVSMTNGLIALSSGGAYLITGGANDAAVTPSSVKAPPQAFSGAQALSPLRIGDHILYAQARGSGVRDLAFSFYSNNFTGTDISVLSGHLLEGRQIVQWAYAEEPNKIAWAVRDDGILLSLTYLKEQEVYGWARHDTQGEVISVCSIPEDREDAVYLVVRRYTPDYGFQYRVERMASRLFGANPAANIPAQIEETWCVDDGAEYAPTRINTAISGSTLLGIGTVFSVSIDAGGAGYTGTPAAQVVDPTGTGAALALTQTGGVIDTATVVAPGTGYTMPHVVVTGSGSGAVLSVRITTVLRITVEGSPFTSGDIGKVVRVRGGKGTVVAVPAANQIDVDFFAQPPSGLPNVPGLVLPRVEANDWSMTTPVQIVGGLDHLNSSVVQVLADGGVQTPKTVVDGCITLDTEASRIIVGQGFTAQLQTMRLETSQPTSQGKRKTVSALHVRVKDTRGLAVGASWDFMNEIKERENEPMGDGVQFQTGGGLPLTELYPGAPSAPDPLWYADRSAVIGSAWSEDGVVCLQQSYPLPATVLAVIPSILEGDTAR